MRQDHSAAIGQQSANQAVSDHDAPLLAGAIAAAGEAAYRWDIASDMITWSDNAALVLQRGSEAIESGRKFAALLDADNLTTRFDAVMHSSLEPRADGVPYRIEYQLKATAQAPAMWVEDHGRWFAGPDGRPATAFGVVHPVTDRHEQDQHLSYLSHNDSLTGVMNRARMLEALDEAISAAAAEGTPCAFAVAAINNLDVINEAYGFEVADEVITAVAERLRKVMRSGDGIGRHSGSKFGIILNSCQPAELNRALDRFLLAVRDGVIETKHGPVWALLSIGAVTIPEGADSDEIALARAEESLSRALRQPSDAFVVYEHSKERDTQRMLNARCAAEIIECLKEGVFHLAYQPVVNAVSGETEIHEALLRMRDTAGEFVAAGHLVPVAERLGLIRLIDRAVVQLAIETLHRYPEARLSINVSATTANDARWNSQLINMIASAEPLNERLIVEITETTALTDLSVALAFFEKLRAAGCCIAIDDFGAGFTSFRNLRDLPVDIIKLDGSYCRNLAKDGENAYFAKTLIDLAHRFGIKTVAEWVETQEDADILCGLGIDYLQGNHIGTPQVTPPWSNQETPAFSFDGEAPHALGVVNSDALFSGGAGDRDAEAAPEPAEMTTVVATRVVTETFAEETFEVDLVESLPDDEPDPKMAAESEPDPLQNDEEAMDAAEDSLAKLKAALAELSAHFAAKPAEEETEGSDDDLKIAS